MFHFFKTLFQHFSNKNTFQKGAALAYYAVFSLLPIIMIVTSILGIFFGEEAVSGEIYTQLQGILGDEAALQIQNIIKNQHTHHNNVLTTIIGFVTLALSASGMFSQLHGAFNSIWDLKAKPKSSILAYLTHHVASFSILITLFFILLVSTTINGFLVKHANNLPNAFQLSYLLEHLVSYIMISLVFALMFKFLGDAIVHWKVTLVGGFFTALLFTFGKVGIGLYIGHTHIASKGFSCKTLLKN